MKFPLTEVPAHPDSFMKSFQFNLLAHRKAFAFYWCLMKSFFLFLASSGAFVGMAAAQIPFNFDETISGDLSDDYLAPTPLIAGLGNNVLSGSLSGNTNDLDLYELIVPEGLEVTAIRLLEFDSAPSNGGSFLLMQPGRTLDAPPSNRFANPIGFSILSSGGVGSDILPTIILPGIDSLAPFFGVASLTSGSYAGWLNETGAASNYRLQFEVAETIPEPSTGLLICFAAVGLCLRQRK